MITPDTIAAARTVWLPALIGATVSLARQGRNFVGLCPFHSEKTPSFHVYPDHYHCFGCGSHGDSIEWLKQRGGLSFGQAIALLAQGADLGPIRKVASSPPAEPADGCHTELARRIWCEAIPIEETPGEVYLHFRHLRLPSSPVLRFHPSCPRGSRRQDRLPAVIGLMCDPISRTPTGIHRTFVAPNGQGKAAVGKPKMTLGKLGVVRLTEPQGEAVGVAEGMETALGCDQLIGWGPVWSTCGRVGMAKFPVLPRTTLTIFSDSGVPGMSAAKACADRWHQAGAEVWVHVPPRTVSDWLELAINKGLG